MNIGCQAVLRCPVKKGTSNMVNWRNLLLGATLPVLLLAAKADAGTLNRWAFDRSSNKLSFTLSEAAKPNAFLIFNPQRVVIDLPGTTLGSVVRKQDYGDRIKQIRLGQPRAGTTRLVVELAEGYILDTSKAVLKRTSGNNWEINLNGIVAVAEPGARGVALRIPTSGGSVSPATPIPSPTPTPTPTPTPAPTPPVSNRPVNRQFCASRTSSVLGSILNKNRGARWGVLVQDASDRTLFDRNASTLLAPASNNKLFTTAAALSKLGPNYQITTPVLGSSSSSTVNQLRIVGQGDPSLRTTDLNSLAQQLRSKGIRKVNLMVGDDTTFKGPNINPNWEAEDIGQAYAPPVNSLIINENIIGLILAPARQGQRLNVRWEDPTDQQFWRLDNRSVTSSRFGGEFLDVVPSGNRIVITGQLRAGSSSEPVGVAIPNEGNYLVRKFDDALEKAGLEVTRTTRVTRTPAPKSFVQLAAVKSAPLSKLVETTNLQSNNLYAESLLKILGSQRLPTASDSRISGISAIKEILQKQGVSTQQIRMVDGSGLAPNNRASARALVQTLQVMSKGSNADVFRQSLPVAGRSGTLSTRFRGTPAQDRVFAKTGTISNVVSLAGYVTPPNHPPLSFAILVNDRSSPSALRALADEMVVFLSQLESGC